MRDDPLALWQVTLANRNVSQLAAQIFEKLRIGAFLDGGLGAVSAMRLVWPNVCTSAAPRQGVFHVKQRRHRGVAYRCWLEHRFMFTEWLGKSDMRLFQLGKTQPDK